MTAEPGSAPVPGVAGAPPLLEVRGLSAAYGHVGVLRDVSLTVSCGEVVTLVGANGAGKSTLLRALMGLVHVTGGDVLLDGARVTGTAPERLVRRGVALVPEGRGLFGPMSVEENLRLGVHALGREGAAAFTGEAARVCALFPVLADRMTQAAETLSGGEQQMLAVARALMGRPRLLLLDEPSLGLAPRVISEIFGTLDVLRAEGVTVLLVEQDVNVALRHADRGYVMRTGEVVLAGTSEELLANDHVRRIYLGAWDDGETGARGAADEGKSRE